MTVDVSDELESPAPLPQRRKFTREEDLMLRSLVEKFGTHHWHAIARSLPGRSARQCRDRYMNYLMDSLIRNPWTHEEDIFLIVQVHRIGPKWVRIGRMLNGRSATSVKNRWYKRVRKLDPFRPFVPLAAKANGKKRRLNLSQVIGITDLDWLERLGQDIADTEPLYDQMGFLPEDDESMI
jgi:hypothetical protein